MKKQLPQPPVSQECDTSSSEDSSDSDEHASPNKNDVSMADLLKLQSNIGTKAFSQIDISNLTSTSSQLKSKKFKNANNVHMNKSEQDNDEISFKNRPKEIPMRRKVVKHMSHLVPGQNIKRKVNRDPRFDDLSGNLDVKAWKKNYSFIKDTREKEKNMLKKELKEESDGSKKEQIKSIITRMENQERESKKLQMEKDLKFTERKAQIDALKEGKKPHFVSKSEKKLQLQALHFEKLKNENRLEKYLTRQDKKTAAKERKKL